MDAFIGTILPWSTDWAPRGWFLCQGQELQIREHAALYAIVGLKYGGNGSTTFKLPDLRGRVLVGMGQGEGLTNRPIGQKGGSEEVTLLTSQIPPHNHSVTLNNTFSAGISGGSISNGTCEVTVNLPNNATTVAGNATSVPSSNTCLGVARTTANQPINIYSTNTPDTTLQPNSVQATGTVAGTVTGTVNGTVTGTVNTGVTGSGTPVANMQPYLILNYIICYQGIFPDRP
ncbi:tail fiber protein [Lysinibacillus macroides]|uniref:Phage tail collar protein n=1 Tax=Lysinibacillus macroides TaxID=33935 RepID=A0A0M9DM99_9BACI|nr:tail fiber protein [Lysinibacillus macroides]KOY83799.1 phage tail collar protein [Lysinibacillus macroides]QPR67066.1 tail fiber protein [Lysinibacillus macroides]